MEKTIKYLENGEYHYATVRSVGDLAQLKTDSKETLVEAINELWNGGGNADPSKAPKPEGYDQLVQDVADAVKNQQEISQQWIEWQNEETQLTEERKQAYLQAMKEMQEAIDKAKADAAALDDKTTKLDEQITKTFSDLDTSIQNMHEQLQKEADRMNQELIDTKSDLTKVRTDLQNAQLDNGRIHDELTNINGKFEHKVWQTDLDPLKEQIDRAETSVQQTKDELLGKASREDLDTVTNAVSKLDTQLKETAKGVEISVKEDELGGDVARLLNDKTNLLLGTRNFAGDKWSNLDHWHEEPGYWKGLKVFSSTEMWYGIQYQYEVKKGNQYTFSFYARQQSENNSAYIMLSEGSTGSQRACTEPYQKSDTHIGTEWKRYSLTFQAIADGTIYPRVEQSVANNTIYVAGYKLELGKNATPWEPNEADIAENIEHTESQFNVYSDQIAGIVKKQEKMGDTERQLDTRITETAEGLKQTSKDLQDANGKITEFKGQLESTAHGLKTEYEKYTNDAIGQISDSTLNLIRNSSFQNKDEDFDQWQNISAKANVRSDENGLRWVELTQSGLTTDNPQGLTSNYFNIKQGKVTVAVDIKSGDKATLDNESVLFLELYNDAKKRVDFKFVTLSELGLNKTLLDDHKVHRGLYRLGIDRNDAKYMTVKAHLMRNGDLYFTNFSARLSSIDDGAYEPNPDDLNQQILKQNTKIEQNSKEVAIKANSVDVTRDIKSAVDNVQVGGVNLVENGDANASNTTPWPNTLCQNHDFYFNGTKKMFNLHTASKNELAADNVKWIPIEAGQQYTLSFKGFMSWNVSSYDVWLLGRKVGTNGAWTNSFPIISGQRLSNSHCETITKTFTAPSDWNNFEAYLRFDNNGSSDGNDSVFFFNEVKLEKGNKATSYSPAPGDISAEIKSAKDAAIQVASGQINLRVNELSTQFDDKLNKRINEQKTASEKFTTDGIEQTVTKITNVKNDVDRLGDKVNGISVGTSNLLHNSDTFEGWHKGASVSISNEKYLNGSVAILNNSGSGGNALDADLDGPYDNQPISWAVYAKADNAGDKLHTELWGGGGFTDQPLTTEWQVYKFTGQRDARNHSFYLWGCQGNKGKVYVALPFAVIGNAIGTWTPNSEDINKKIDTQVLDSANINDMKTQGHYFVKNLTGNPLAGWVYVDVMGFDGRIRQDVYQDGDSKHMYRRLFGSNWSNWEQGAYISDVNNVKTEVTASVKNLGDRVITQVNSVETKVDNLSVGGRNYISPKNIKGYYAHEPQYNASTQEWTVVIDNGTGGAWGGGICFQGTGIVVPWGQAYTDSVEVYVTDSNLKWNVDTNNSSVAGASWSGNDNDNRSALTATPALNSVIPTNQWYRLSVTAWNTNPKNTNHVGINDFSGFGIINNTGHTVNVKFRRPKQELGSKATDWSPNPDDTIEAIKEVNTKWGVANGQIQGKVTETQVNNILNGKGYATQSWAETMFQMKKNSITLQAVRDNITNGIQNQLNDTRNQLNNMQVGGRNYLQESDKLVTGWGQDLGTMPSEALNSLAGKTITVSVDVQWNDFKHDNSKQNRLGFELSVSGSDGHSYWLGAWKTPTTARGKERISTQYSLPAGVTFTVNNNGQNGYVSINGTGKVSHAKIEVGNVATDWSPAPNDDIGTNLLKGTADFSGNWRSWSDPHAWKHDGWTDPNGNQAVGLVNKIWEGYYQPRWLEAGTYTFSCYYWISGTTTGANVFAIPNGGENPMTLLTASKGLDTTKDKWHKAIFSFTVTKAGNSALRIELSDSNATLHVASYKLEKGSTATDWSPAPEDSKSYTDQQITNTNKKIDTQVLDSANVDDLKTQGHYFVKNLANSPIAGWVYVDVTGGTDRLKQDVYQDSGYEHKSRRWFGSYWTEWTTDVNNKNIVSQINITPDQIKIASNKIVIDGNTDIHGDLRTDRVRLVGKNGAIDMTGDTGIKLTNNDGSSMLLGRGNIDLMYKNDFRMNIDSSLMTIMQRNQFTTQKNPIAILNIGSSWNHSNNQIRGADIRYNPGNVNDVNLHGADYLALSYNKPNLTPGEANIKPQLVMAYQDLKFDENHYLWRKGVNVADDLTIQEYQRINVGYRDKEDQSGKWTNDPLMIHRMQWSNSYQADRYQPTIRLGYSKDSMGHAGVTFLWDQVKPFGDRDISDLGSIWFNGQRFVFGWASHKRMFGNQQQPAFMRLDDKGEIMSGIAFTPGSTWDLGSGAWNITASVMNNGG